MSQPAHPTDTLLSLVYGELPLAEARAVQAHVESCPECSATVAGYRAVQKAAAVLPRALEPTRGLEALLQAGAEATRGHRRRAAVRASALFSGGATAALLLLLVLFRSPGRESPAGSAPSAVGPLAQADVPRQETGRTELDEGHAPAPRAAQPAAAPPAFASGARAKAAPLSSLSAEKKRAADGPSEATALGAGGGAGQAGQAAVAGAPLASRVSAVSRAPADAAKSTAASDAARRQVLLERLSSASLVEALPLRLELCTLEARLGLKAEANVSCGRVVQDYPRTEEADVAQKILEALRAH